MELDWIQTLIDFVTGDMLHQWAVRKSIFQGLNGINHDRVAADVVFNNVEQNSDGLPASGERE